MSLTKKRRMEGTNEPDDLLIWFEEILSREEESADADELEEIITTQSDHNSDSEQEASAEDKEEEEDHDENFFVGKDQTTKWKRRSNLQVRRRAHNIITYLPGPKRDKN